MSEKNSHGKVSGLEQRSGGLAAWSVRHPVGVSMIALAVIVLGTFALARLAIDLLPHIIYPEIQVRIIDPGVPATIMEDRITRQLEEQLAITEDAISVQSTTSQGNSSVSLSFNYGKDIDVALRDASTRLDRAKRFLPDTIDPPVIFKRDPSQIPVMELVVSSSLRSSVDLRSWSDDVLRKWFLNLPGVAAVEIGGGLLREIHIIPDQKRLAGYGLNMQDIVSAIQNSNREDPAGRLQMVNNELSGKISARFKDIKQIAALPLRLPNGDIIELGEIAQVLDTHQDERIKVRADGIPGVKLSVQKQPNANTVAVVEVVQQRLNWLKEQGILPDDIDLSVVSDQSIYIRQSLSNSSNAAISGALLAMAVVYLFLGNLRRTLIIGSAIPIAIMVTFILMGMSNLTLNIMTLGGLALGIGMLVDNTIVMLENISRHQQTDDDLEMAPIVAAKEVNSAIVASTTTNLAAVLPFLFVGGLTGLMFQELIVTISAAILASMVIALTLVPALAARVPVTRKENWFRLFIDKMMAHLQNFYAAVLRQNLRVPWLMPMVMIALLIYAAPTFFTGKQEFLPKMDDGNISVRISTDPGVNLEEMDRSVRIIEDLIRQQPETFSVFSLIGGSIFGRSEREIPNQSTLTVQLVPVSDRQVSSDEWIKRVQELIGKKQLAGLKVRMNQRGIRGIRTSQGDDDISLRIQGDDNKVLTELADDLVAQLSAIKGLKNIAHTFEESHYELSIEIDQRRASALQLEVSNLSQAMQIALQGTIVTEFLDGDKAYQVRLRLPQGDIASPQDLESVLLYPAAAEHPAVYLSDVANVKLVESPAEIKRDNQMRIVEVSASIAEDATLGGAMQQIDNVVENFQIPDGYTIYEGGAKQLLQESEQLANVLIGLALFLVLVVMAVQYESLLNPVIIILSVPFAAIGVAAGINWLDLPLSMPIWLGMIMLAGIVVNNAIVLVEYIEILRAQGVEKKLAIVEAGRLRLRPILMTTLTTVVGMLPLAMSWGEGSEMLQPLAITITWGLSFSTLVSLLVIPSIYSLMHIFEKSKPRTH